MDGWKTSFLLGWPIFRGYVRFRECNESFLMFTREMQFDEYFSNGLVQPPHSRISPPEIIHFRKVNLRFHIFSGRFFFFPCIFSAGNVTFPTPGLQETRPLEEEDARKHRQIQATEKAKRFLEERNVM